MASNTFPISQYSYAKTATARESFEWRHQEFAQMKLSLTKPRGRLIMKVLKKKDPLETIPVSELLKRASESGTQQGVGSRARPVDVHYGEMQLAIVYNSEDNQVKRVRVRLVDSDDLQTAVQLLRAAGCSVRNPLQKKSNQPQRPGTAATDPRPTSRAEGSPERRPYTSYEQKPSSSSRPPTAASDRAERPAHSSSGGLTAMLPGSADTNSLQDTQHHSHSQQEPAYARFEERAPSYSHGVRPPTGTGWPPEQMANLPADSQYPMHRGPQYRSLEPSSHQDRLPTTGNTLHLSGPQHNQQGFPSTLTDKSSFVAPRSEDNLLGAVKRFSTSRDSAVGAGPWGPMGGLHDNVVSEPPAPPSRQDWTSEQRHEFGLRNITSSMRPVQNIDDLIPPRKLPFTPLEKNNSMRDGIVSPTRPHTVSTSFGNPPKSRLAYSRESSSAFNDPIFMDERRIRSSPPKGFTPTSSAFAMYQDQLSEQRPSKRARHGYSNTLGAQDESIDHVASMHNAQLRPLSNHQLNERTHQGEGVASARHASLDVFGLSGYANKATTERQRDLEQQMLAMIDNDDFVALCEDMEVSSARLALGD